MASRYDALARYLEQQSGPSHTMSFAQIEDVIGGPLPPSSRSLRNWWQNTYSSKRRHVQAIHGWHAAGWEVDSVDLIQQTVTFRK